MSEAVVKNFIKLRFAVYYGADSLKGNSKLSEKLYFKEQRKVVFTVITVSVFKPFGRDEPLSLIKADIGPFKPGFAFNDLNVYKDAPFLCSDYKV